MNKPSKHELKETNLGYHSLNPVLSQDLVYADDIVLMKTSENRLRRKQNYKMIS